MFILLFLPFAGLNADPADDGVFSAAGVQFEIDADTYRTENTFFSEVKQELNEIIEDSSVQPDIVIFPEYTGVFFQLIEYNDVISGYENFQKALIDVVMSTPGVSNLADVFTSSDSEISYLERWSRIADKYNIYAVAGSCFVTAEDGTLRNRSFVFDPDGELIYQQDKVFLTDFETDIVGLEPGSIEEARMFNVEGRKIALTICRDTYSPEWEDKFSDAFLWIDIKANGEVFDAEQRESFMRALPLRVINSGVRYGITVCAVGNYMDLFWEGESSAFYNTGNRLALADISDSCDSEDRIFFNIRTQ